MTFLQPCSAEIVSSSKNEQQLRAVEEHLVVVGQWAAVVLPSMWVVPSVSGDPGA